MANVLGSLFQDIANAIRGKTGDTSKLTPNEFASAITGIPVISGGSSDSGGTVVGNFGSLKFATGSFNTGTTGIYRQSIEHGLGVRPDFVMVYQDGLLGSGNTAESVAETMPVLCLWGLHSKFASMVDVASYTGAFAWSFVNASAFLDIANENQIYCPNDTVFQFGQENDGSNTTGRGLLVPDSPYGWIAIAGMGSAVSDDVRYVTFRNESTGEEFVKAVATGDDCVDVVAKGLWATPTKESDAQYDYTFYSWGAEDGGAADSTILQNITENKTVYAIYTKTVRYYTVTYYDDDGTTVLNTETLPYGTVPSYVAVKDGAAFDSWTPTPVAVTGDASYTAVWGSAIASGESGNITWVLYLDGTLNISGTGAMNAYSSGTAPWYSHASEITSVIIEDGVTSIGSYAFASCAAMESVTIPDSVTSIGNHAFNRCTGLTSITIPEKVTAIQQYTFNGCTKLESVNLPDGITTVGELAFKSCTKLTSLNLTDNCVNIGVNAFQSCGITTIHLSNKMTTINGSTFTKSGLVNITIPASVTKISALAFNNCSSLASVTFENTEGWSVTTNSSAATGTAISVTNEAANATNLATTYASYYWNRS